MFYKARLAKIQIPSWPFTSPLLTYEKPTAKRHRTSTKSQLILSVRLLPIQSGWPKYNPYLALHQSQPPQLCSRIEAKSRKAQNVLKAPTILGFFNNNNLDCEKTPNYSGELQSERAPCTDICQRLSSSRYFRPASSTLYESELEGNF